MDSVEIRALSKFLTEMAKEINEVPPTRITNDLQSLKDWLQKQPQLIARTDDQFLVVFLRGCKYNLERCKTKLEFYLTMRNSFPEFFSNRDPTNPDFIGLMRKGITCPLPIPLPNGSRPFLCRPFIYDPERISINDYQRFSFMVVDRYLTEDDHMNVCGECLLIDMKGLTVRHVAQMTISYFKRASSVILNGYPVRHRGIHLINIPPGLDAFFRMCQSVYPKKIIERIHYHSNLESLYEHMPKKCLPAEYGGEAGTIDEITGEFMKQYLTDTNWFAEDSKYGCDETKRIDSPKKPTELFGVDGSFRRLEID